MHCAVDELRLLDSKDIEKMLKTGQMREDEFFKSSVSHVFVIVLQILISVDFSMDSVHLLLNRFTQRMIYREFYWTFYIQMIEKYNLVNSTFLEDQIKKLLLDEKQKYCHCWIDICALNPKILDELVVEVYNHLWWFVRMKGHDEVLRHIGTGFFERNEDSDLARSLAFLFPKFINNGLVDSSDIDFYFEAASYDDSLLVELLLLLLDYFPDHSEKYFLKLCHLVNFNHKIFIDWLKSNETDFLCYLIRYFITYFSVLKHISGLQDNSMICNMMKKIAKAISESNLPYDASPLQRLIHKVFPKI